MRSGLSAPSAAVSAAIPVRCAPSAPARMAMSGTAVEEKRDVAGLDDGRDRLGAIDQRALVAVCEAQQHGGDIAGVERRGKRARKRLRVADRRGDQINPLARRVRGHHDIRPRAAGEDFLSVTPPSVPDRPATGRARRGRSSRRDGRRRAAPRRRSRPCPTRPFAAPLAARGRRRRSRATAAGPIC